MLMMMLMFQADAGCRADCRHFISFSGREDVSM